MDHYIFTGTDLDSATSYMVFNWLTGKRIPVQYVTRANLEQKVKQYFTKNIQPNRITYFVNLDTSPISRLVDRENVVIIDHHPDHIAKQSVYNKCKPILKQYSSCCKLLYVLLSKKLPGKLTNDQLRLMFLADDNTSYSFKIQNSYELGIVYNNLQGDKPVRYHSRFNNGFSKFSDGDLTLIQYHVNKFESVKQQLHPFIGTIPINKIPYKFVSAFAQNYINETSDHLLKTYKAAVCILINTESDRVSFRRDKECDLDLKRLAQRLCNGWGYEYAAGGTITEKLLQFSRLFNPQHN